MAAWAAILPGCDIEPFHIKFERTPDGLLATGAPSGVEGAVTPQAAFLLGDPFSCAVDSMLAHFGEEFSGMPVLGGMASGASAPGENRLYLNDAEFDHGGVGVVIRGPVSIRTVVSQGCRPIGQPLVVTKSSRNVLQELGGKPALEQLNSIYRASSPSDQLLIQRKLHIGLAMSEYKEQFQRGDFLISNVIGADRDQGAIAVGNLVRTGQTVQFHVRRADCCSAAMVAAPGCFRHRITMRTRSSRWRERSRWRGSLLKVNWARWRAATTFTGSQPVWPSSDRDESHDV
jgi:small ligand-binding sensory domain FIST